MKLLVEIAKILSLVLLPIFGFPHKNEKIQKNISKKYSEEIQKNNRSEKRMLECQTVPFYSTLSTVFFRKRYMS